ncbi:Nif3-like dinuclear metal center hexameric protein [Neisseriaceae bacterium PsAf]|nr:Nif3-like dinuclear metal center hexameric protein [Neisseriaceae bacterium PsAf]
MKREKLLNYLNQLLNIDLFSDYSPLGLQVEGKEEVLKIVTAVTASLKAIDFATKNNVDMLLVHHGMFWKNEADVVTGWKKKRLQELLKFDLNLVAYHLPLDAHPELGNNAQLAKKMQWVCQKTTGEQGLLCVGELINKMSLNNLEMQLEIELKRKPLVIGRPNKEIKKIGWCTGGGQNFFLEAIAQDVDVFVTGEASQAQYHFANETDVAFISAGHHATERYGVLALGEHIQEKFGLEVIFFDEKNPI